MDGTDTGGDPPGVAGEGGPASAALPVGDLAQDLLDALPLGVAVFDLAQRFVAVNAAMVQINGLVGTRYVGRTVHEVFGAPYGERLSAILGAVAATGQAVLAKPVEGVRPGPGAGTLQGVASWLPLCDREGRVVATVALVEDRTGRIEQAEADDRRRRTVEALIGALPVAVVLLDESGHYQHANAATTALLGVPVEEHLGRTVAAVYPPEVAATVNAMSADPPEVRRATYEWGQGSKQQTVEITAFPVPGYGWGYSVVDQTAVRTAARRAEIAAHVAATLASTGSPEAMAAVVAGAVGEELGAMSVGTVVAEGTWCRFLSMTGYPAETVAAWERFPRSVDIPLTRALRTGAERWWDTQDEVIRAFPHTEADIRAAGVHAGAAVPLVVDGRAVGALALAWRRDRTVGPDDRRWVRTLADMLAPGLERARQAAQERHVADVLQASLLPQALPVPPWLEVAALHRPMAGAQVGGDVYDLVQLGEGDVALLVADVCGHGVDAAALTATVRHGYRTVLLDRGSCRAALAAVDRTLAAGTSSPEHLATAWTGRLRRQPDGTVEVRALAAGHPRAVLRRADGTVAWLGAPAPLLGLGTWEPVPPERAVLGPGDLLVIWTDGLMDSPRPRLRESEVAALVAAGPGSAAALAGHLLAATDHPTPADDTALVVVAPLPAA